MKTSGSSTMATGRSCYPATSVGTSPPRGERHGTHVGHVLAHVASIERTWPFWPNPAPDALWGQRRGAAKVADRYGSSLQKQAQNARGNTNRPSLTFLREKKPSEGWRVRDVAWHRVVGSGTAGLGKVWRGDVPQGMDESAGLALR
jgi:hypothetical protein